MASRWSLPHAGRRVAEAGLLNEEPTLFSGATVHDPAIADRAGRATRNAAGAVRAREDQYGRPLRWPIWITIATLVVFVATVTLELTSRSQEAALAQTTGELLMHLQRIARIAPNAVGGDAAAFIQLRESRDRLASGLETLDKEGLVAERRFAASARPQLDALRSDWKRAQDNADVILADEKPLASIAATLRSLGDATPALADASEDIMAQKLQSNASPRDVAAAAQLQTLTQRLARHTNGLLARPGAATDVAAAVVKDANAFHETLDGLLNGSESLRLGATREPDLRSRLVSLQRAFADYETRIGGVVAAVPTLVIAKQAADALSKATEPMQIHLRELRGTTSGESSPWLWGAVLSGLVTLLGALFIARSSIAGAALAAAEARQGRLEAERHEENLKATNEANQAAILRLMNELQEVADGNLTMQATVSEDITGAIADSVNYTVEELRTLVARINSTVEQVTVASSSAQLTSKRLLDASDEQSREIRSTGNAVLAMARQINDVSGSAAESAAVARQSLAAAEHGQRAVQDSIAGMNGIRDQIQETSKRIKRLGESSQEIGEIIELISDITEQTNVLALNAAIQAASAGEAGRGFSVVAEEVQRLAERSGEATKQIGALVRTIQVDTQDAVSAMEKSTEEVVEGAQLSDVAGQSLGNIGRVSKQLAELIDAISRSTSMQATSAGRMTTSMEHILSVNEQASDGTRRTATSIQQLSELALELKSSVSRFKVN